MVTKIDHHHFPKDDVMPFQPINPKTMIYYKKDSIMALDSKFIK